MKQTLSGRPTKLPAALLALAMLSAWLALAVTASWAEDARAQEDATRPGAEEWRKTAPKPAQPRPFKIPGVVAYKLENGLSVQLVEDHRVPFVTAYLGIKAGSSLEPPELSGLASMCADMLTEGSRTRSSKQIAEEIDFIGGGLKGSADFDFTTVSGSTLSKYTDRLFEVMSDVVLNPSFPEDELKLSQTNLIQQLVMKRSKPDFLCDERLSKVLFGDHPYAQIAPTPETVKRISVESLKKFHHQHYLPNESVLVVVGDFQTAAMKELIEKSFGSNWRAGTMPTVKPPSYPDNRGRRIYLVDRPGSVQSALKLGNVAIKKTDPDYFPLLVANQILGGAAHSRLFLNIREQKGYTYGAYSGFSARKEPGAFAAHADVRTEVTAPSIEEFLYELDRVRNLKVSDRELKDAKSYLSGSFQLGLETQAGLATRLLEVELYDLPKDYLEKYTDNIEGVTADDIRSAARKHIDLANMTIVVVGDASKIKSELEYFAPVEVYDAAGKLTAATTGTLP